MEFCQIQFNYLDYSFQNAKEKLELLAQYHLPVWVMEPLRGGKLVNLPSQEKEKLETNKQKAAALEGRIAELKESL